MAASLIGWIWQQSNSKQLSTGARLTLFAINEHVNIGEHGDWRVYPSQERLAQMVNCTDKTLRKYLYELQEAELLVIAHQFDESGRQRSNLYWLTAPKLLDVGEENLPTGVGKDYRQEGVRITDKSLNKESLNKEKTIRPKPKPSNNPDPKFVLFWEKYGRKQKKRDALKAWHGMSDQERKDALHFVSSKDFQAWRSAQFRGGECYLPYPSTWLRAHQWEDELVHFGGVNQESDFARLGRMAKEREARESKQ